MDDTNQNNTNQSQITDENAVEKVAETASEETAPKEDVAEETIPEATEDASSETDEVAVDVKAATEDSKDEAVSEKEVQETNSPVSEQETTGDSTDKQATDAPQTDEPTATATPAKDTNPNAKWYVVHTYSGHENKVAVTLKQRVESEHLQEKILDVLVPVQDKIEIKGGKKATVKEKIFPGYILVKMVLDDLSWLAVRTTQGVTSFVGIGNKPTPISDAEVQTIVKFTQSEAPVYKQVFQANDTVKIVDGPFSDFIGKIDNVDEERGKVKVLVSIFGRETPVELDFLQIQKI